MTTIRQLIDSDRKQADSFLTRHSETCLFMRSNIADAGLVYRGLRYQGDHYGAFEGDDLIGIIAHYWNGNIMIQMNANNELPISLLRDEILKNAQYSNRSIMGFLGPYDQIKTFLDHPKLKKLKRQHNGKEHLLGLNLNELITPDLCNDPDYSIRPPSENDRNLMVYWLYDYEVETGISSNSSETKERVNQDVQEFMTNGKYWLFEYQKKPVGFVGFNAVITDTVQPGGIWTPPQHRNKGYARAATAMILKLARDEWGKTKSVIFTNNPAAEKAYVSLGYHFFGHYALITLAKPYLPKM